ncbi:M14 family metallopeptidase [Herpetosiphon llansteffanensis]
MPAIDYTRYYRFDELVAALEGFAAEYPQLMSLQSIGKSYEGRDLWLATLTNDATGTPREKPAFWVDANIHASEVTGAMAGLHLIDTLLKGYGNDPECTRLLDRTTFYILPRFNPDGAERALTTPYVVRSSVRPYPYAERVDGLYQEDINDDGIILQMRLVDPNGDWRVSEHDPRVMVKRKPYEIGGTYYRILPEGLIQNYDGVNIKLSRSIEGLDINRNFPIDWRPEAEQYGAGPYPTSEPEIRAVVQFIVDHPEIHSGLTYHTYSGVLLRPYGDRADDQMNIHDLDVFKALGKRGTEITGWPSVSVYHDFRYHPKDVITGVFDDWVYDHLGMFAWTVEFWDLVGSAGIKDRKFIEWFKEHPEEDDLKIMQWVDEHGEGLCFYDWTPFEHPQLGAVEIGGWHPMFAFRNPPPAKLLETIAPVTQFALEHAAIAPFTTISSFELESLGDNVYRLQAVVQNEGYLPSYGSQKGRERKATLPLEALLQLPEGASLKLGQAKTTIGDLEGRSGRVSFFGFSNGSTTDRAKVEWVVHVPNPGVIELTVQGGRGGIARAKLEF